MSVNRENNLARLLKAVVDDFDQTGCSAGVGTVSTAVINEAREYLGFEPLEDEEGKAEDKYEPDESLGDESEESDLDANPEDESTP